MSARDELAEAAAKETARVYGQLCPEHHRRLVEDRPRSTIEVIREMRWLGASVAEIALALGLPRQRVEPVVRRLDRESA